MKKACVLVFTFFAALSLMAGGRMGVSIMYLKDGQINGKKGQGVYISQVHQESGAARAGLQKNDALISIDGVAVRNLDDLKILEDTEPGDVVAVKIRRDGEVLDYDVELSDQSEIKYSNAYAFNFNDGDWSGKKWAIQLGGERAYMGIHEETLAGQLASFFKVDSGVLVKEVLDESPAELAGLQAGDVIIGWGEDDIEDSKGLHSMLREAKKDDVIQLSIIRDGDRMTLPITLGAKDGGNFSYNFNFDPNLKIDLESLGDDVRIAIPDFENFHFDFSQIGEWDEEKRAEFENRMKELSERFRGQLQIKSKELKQKLKDKNKIIHEKDEEGELR